MSIQSGPSIFISDVPGTKISTFVGNKTSENSKSKNNSYLLYIDKAIEEGKKIILRSTATNIFADLGDRIYTSKLVVYIKVVKKLFKPQSVEIKIHSAISSQFKKDAKVCISMGKDTEEIGTITSVISFDKEYEKLAPLAQKMQQYMQEQVAKATPTR